MDQAKPHPVDGSNPLTSQKIANVVFLDSLHGYSVGCLKQTSTCFYGPQYLSASSSKQGFLRNGNCSAGLGKSIRASDI